jgi:DNA-binding CsgD family transcriptional regulator
MNYFLNFGQQTNNLDPVFNIHPLISASIRGHLPELTQSMIDWDLTEKLFFADSQPKVLGVVEQWIRGTAWEKYGFAAKLDKPFSDVDASRVLIAHSYSGDWGHFYQALRNPDAAQQDARVQSSLNGLPAIAWTGDGRSSSSDLLDRLVPTGRSKIKKSSEFGLKAGITVPLMVKGCEWGFFTFSTMQQRSIRQMSREVAECAHIAAGAVAAIQRALLKQYTLKLLNNREKEVLRWAALGKTSWEISVILKISERTVNFHFSEAARKLGVKGRRAACTAAMVQGLIQIS